MDNTAELLVAKSSGDNKHWLPLWVHSVDTLVVIDYLLDKWLPPNVCKIGLLNGENFCKLARLLAVFHDLGKATISFQNKILKQMEPLRALFDDLGLNVSEFNASSLKDNVNLNHAAMGELLAAMFTAREDIALIVGAHHGKPWSEGNELLEIAMALPQQDYDNGTTFAQIWGGMAEREAWRCTQRMIFEWMLKVLNMNLTEISELPSITKAAQVLLTGLIIMADWIASNTSYFPLIPIDRSIPENIERRAEIGLKRLALPPVWRPSIDCALDVLVQKRFGFEANTVQSAMIEAIQSCEQPGIFILEAPMGIGKTEAALLGAELLAQGHAGGLFFGLPTQATANGVFNRVVEWGKMQAQCTQQSIRLAHGMATLNEDYRALMHNDAPVYVEQDGQASNGLVVHEWFQGSKQALLANFVVGTVDQVLMASLKQKHFMLRHLGLAGKVIIIDECHAYDAYMNQYLERTLNWLGKYHAPVIMLSATLPYERRAALIDAYLNKTKKPKHEIEPWRTAQAYPLLTWTDQGHACQRAIPLYTKSRRVRIERLSHSTQLESQAETVAKLLKEKLADGGCAGVILNTVKRAQFFAIALRQAMPDARVLLLHASFVMQDRLNRERMLLRLAGKSSEADERNQLIVVGTQVIEQSLDYDVDVMVTDLCPMDLLLQRIGRLHRHAMHDAIRPKRISQAQCYVLCARDELDNGGVAVYGEYLLMRTRSLLPGQIELPNDVSSLVQRTYDRSPLLEEPAGYARAFDEHMDRLRKERQSAGSFLISLPQSMTSFEQIMSPEIPADETHARAQVRAGDPTVEVLVLMQDASGKLHLLPWLDEVLQSWSTHICPSESDCRKIAAQRLRLPRTLAKAIAYEKISSALAIPRLWQASVWLHNEKLMVLDENLEMSLGKVKLKYTQTEGLSFT